MRERSGLIYDIHTLSTEHLKYFTSAQQWKANDDTMLRFHTAVNQFWPTFLSAQRSTRTRMRALTLRCLKFRCTSMGVSNFPIWCSQMNFSPFLPMKAKHLPQAFKKRFAIFWRNNISCFLWPHPYYHDKWRMTWALVLVLAYPPPFLFFLLYKTGKVKQKFQ